jgi:hypothetical protein
VSHLYNGVNVAERAGQRPHTDLDLPTHTRPQHTMCAHTGACVLRRHSHRDRRRKHTHKDKHQAMAGGRGGVTSVGPRPELPSNNAWYSARSKGTSVVGASAVPHPACLPCFARKFSAERSIRYLRREGSDI